MKRCKSCDKRFEINNHATGVCLNCWQRLRAAAVQRGFSLTEAPLPHEKNERTIEGIDLFFWRDQWRVA